MKFKLLLLLSFIFFQSQAQVSLAPNHFGKPGKFKDGELKQFKSSETIFLVSYVFEKEEYEKILNEVWNVTPFKVLYFPEFKIEEYFDKNISVVQLSGYIKTKKKKLYQWSKLFTYMDFQLYDMPEIAKKYNKLSTKKWEKKKYDIMSDNAKNIAMFHLMANDELTTTFLENKKELLTSMYSKDSFCNFELGFLKNYFQKINDIIIKGKIYFVNKKDGLKELGNLKTTTLYVPDYIGTKFGSCSATVDDESNEYLSELFEEYRYDYKFVSSNRINEKILNGEEFYYLRYIRSNNEKWLQVVNSKTGEIVYRDFMIGTSYHLKKNNVKALHSKIKKTYIR